MLYFDHHLLTVFHRPKSTVHICFDVGEVSSISTFSSRFAKKVKVQKHPQQKLDSASNFCGEKLLKEVQILDMGEKNHRKCRRYQNDPEGLKREENWSVT